MAASLRSDTGIPACASSEQIFLFIFLPKIFLPENLPQPLFIRQIALRAMPIGSFAV